jgi:hypothetical protein
MSRLRMEPAPSSRKALCPPLRSDSTSGDQPPVQQARSLLGFRLTPWAASRGWPLSSRTGRFVVPIYGFAGCAARSLDRMSDFLLWQRVLVLLAVGVEVGYSFPVSFPRPSRRTLCQGLNRPGGNFFLYDSTTILLPAPPVNRDGVCPLKVVRSPYTLT